MLSCVGRLIHERVIRVCVAAESYRHKEFLSSAVGSHIFVTNRKSHLVRPRQESERRRVVYRGRCDALRVPYQLVHTKDRNGERRHGHERRVWQCRLGVKDIVENSSHGREVVQL